MTVTVRTTVTTTASFDARRVVGRARLGQACSIVKNVRPQRVRMSSQAESGTPVHVDSSDHLQQLVSEHDVVLVDFHADWCGPCKMLEPTVEEIAAETDALVAKVDIDELQDLAREEGVRSVPTLQFYADGEKVERLIGVQDKDDLVELVERYD